MQLLEAFILPAFVTVLSLVISVLAVQSGELGAWVFLVAIAASAISIRFAITDWELNHHLSHQPLG
ncbi:MAG: hypothetical protein GY813_07575 [Halieaceae bacterium]|nr:hypothetical protein [Halieaceae bacterium]